ncbi:lantibiotic dehydratase [Streptomyces sp. DSM 40907]|uniref:lantibiotic dehydratase n=1 Tax=Streptomyces kutzneri TaxID=3051179 RepID=UPI0028D7C597|nr:lantibiotic dehydratase [Streptomyces sp. DSM 40907]
MEKGEHGTVSGLYEPAGFVMLRAPMLGIDTFTELNRDPESLTTAEQQAGRVLDAARHPAVGEAVRIASPDLADALDKHARGERNAPAAADRLPGGKRGERLVSSLARYLTRMSSRPTPFGGFAGVAVLPLADATHTVADPAASVTQSRSDMRWLLEHISALEAVEEVVASSRLLWNPLILDASPRFVLPYADVYGDSDNRAITIAATPMLHRIRELCADPVPFPDLLDQLAAEAGEERREAARQYLLALHRQRFLLTGLRPARTDFRPEEHMARLAAERGDHAAAENWAQLRRILDKADATVPGEKDALLAEAASLQHTIHPPSGRTPTLHVDTRLAVTRPSLHQEVGTAAAAAAETLMRLGCYPGRQQHIVDYHGRFVEKYGTETEVPVLELLDPRTGLGAPAGYTQPAPPFGRHASPPPPAPDAQKRYLGRLLADCLSAGQRTLTLTDADVDRLAVWNPANDAPPLPGVDLFCQIQAPSREALDAGDWQLITTADCMIFGGRSMGRFAEVLGEQGRQRLRDYLRAEEERRPDTIHAELSYQPTFALGSNVAVHPGVRPYEIPLSTFPTLDRERQLRLDDLVVGATATRFYLRSLRLGKEVVVNQTHMLVGTTVPNVGRFLLEASHDGYALPNGFGWDDMDTLPFLPRVRHGRAVLRPAQWNVPPETLVGADGAASQAAFDQALAAARERWGIDRHVYVVQMDNRLLLDLDSPLGRGQLRREALTAVRDGSPRYLELHEMLPSADGLWLTDADGRAHVSEIVVPLLTAASGRDDALRARAAEVTHRTAGREGGAEPLRSPRRRFGPATDWTYLKLYLPHDAQDDLITGPLAGFVGHARAAGVLDRWFFIRYVDPDAHLRVRLHASGPQAREALLVEAARWGNSLLESGAVDGIQTDVYEREIERYGGLGVIEHVEEVFSANSDAVVRLLGLTAGDSGISPEHAMVYTHQALYEGWLCGPPAHAPALAPVTDPVRKEFRAGRRALTNLLVPWERHPDPVAAGHHELLAPLFTRQAQAAAAARAALRERHGAAAQDVESGVLASLAHMQSNRFLGVDREKEEHCYGLWQLALHAIRARPRP